MQKIHILCLCHIKSHKASIALHQNILHQTCLVYKLWTCKKAIQKFIFYTMIFEYTLYILHCTDTFPHSLVFNTNTFYKTDNIFLFQELNRFTQKLKVHSKWRWCQLGHFLNFWLHQQLFANKEFCTKTRLCIIFKTTNTKTLIKAISESL